jgi:hypothetical protein
MQPVARQVDLCFFKPVIFKPMNKRFIYIMILAALASCFAGCKTSEEASGTVPWGAPASFEGAGVGLPQMDKQD